MGKIILLISFIMLITGCASNLNWRKPAEDPRGSFHEAYQRCLEQNSENKSKCDEYLGSHLDKSSYFKGLSEHPDKEGYH